MTTTTPPGDPIPRNPRYEIRGRIGRGAMGEVYRAFDRETGTVVALKSLHTRDAEDLYRLKREFRALSDLSHRNLVQLHELVVSETECFLTMELIEGLDFLAFVRPTGVLDEARLRACFSQLAEGLRVIHAAGRLHRDIKPSNVLVQPSGRLVILDFGLAADTGQGLAHESRRGALVGTFAYMSPEQALGGSVGPASDLYSAGVMLYEALTGTLPFDESDIGALLIRRDRRPPHPGERASDLPEDLAALSLALLDPDPLRRPDHAALRNRLQGLAPGREPLRGAAYSGATSFVGRGRELAALEAAYRDSRRGRAVQVLIEGPSGIGKSALAEHFVSGLESRERALVLRSKCLAQASLRFGAADGFVDELSRFLVLRRPAELAALAPRYVDALIRVFPVMGRVPFSGPRTGPEPSDMDPREVRRRAFGALRELVARLADHQPLVLYLDDYQWSDADSVRLMDGLLAGPDPPAVLVLLVQRREQPETEAEDQRADQSRTPSDAAELRCIGLGPLEPEDLERMIGELLADPAHRHAREIARESAGSPFLVRELARAVAEGPDRETAPRLAELVQLRLDQLDAHSQAILAAVAVAGAPIDRSIALEAAGLAEDARPAAERLMRGQLLRLTTVSDRPAVETYHDRIRDAMLGTLAEDRRRSLHAALADALVRSGRATADVLVRHTHGAGRVEEAARLAIEAGDQAAASFAFAQAADFYGMALAWHRWPGGQTRQLFASRAAALVNAGRGAEAAPLYLRAAENAPEAERRVLQRMAAEQFLISGNIEDGIRVLRPLLQTLGVRYPASPRRAMFATLMRLAELRLRGTRFRPRTEAEIPDEVLARIDTCYAASRGLVAVDTVRGGYFSFMGLIHALRAGDPARVGGNLAIAGSAVLAPMGGAMGRWGHRMAEQTRALARQTGHVYLEAAAAMAEGQMAIFAGDWGAAVERSEEAIRLLRTHCRGITWECSVCQTALLRGLEELGQVQECLRRAHRHRATSHELGDRYGVMVASQHLGSSGVAAGDTAAARQQMRQQMANWPSESFLVQHLYALRIEILADLSDGDPASAWRRITEAWPSIEKAQFLRVPITRIDSHLLRGRAALAMASEREDTVLLRQVEQDARRIDAEGRADTRAHAEVLRAGVARIRGDVAASLESLRRAASGFTSVKMELDRACVDWCIAALVGGDEGDTGRTDAEQRIRGAGVGQPERWLRVVAPGMRARVHH